MYEHREAAPPRIPLAFVSMTTLHIKLAAAGPTGRDTPFGTLHTQFDQGWTGYWAVAKAQVGDTLRIHWEGNDDEPAAACSFVITAMEPVLVPGDTIRRKRIVFGQASTHNYTEGWNPPAGGFNQAGIAYTYGDEA